MRRYTDEPRHRLQSTLHVAHTCRLDALWSVQSVLIRYFRSRDCCAAHASQASSKIPAADTLLSPCAEHYGFQLPDNPHDTALLPPAALARHLGGDAAAALPPAQAALHCCGVPTWHLLQVCCRFRIPLTVPDEQFRHGRQLCGLQALRLAAASAKELRNGGHLAAAGMPIGPAAEARQV